MTDTTDTVWTADGVSLQTFAQNITTLGGRFSPPPMRGDDITVPYSPGQRWIAKTPDSRIIPLAMWVRGWNADGSRPTDTARKFDENWRTLRNLLWQPNRQIALKKKFWVEGVLRSATALAQFEGGLEPTMKGRNGAKFVVDLKLADPYFYDDELKTFNLVNGDQTIIVPGDVETRNLLLTINGSRNQIKVISKTVAPDIQVEYYAALNTGDTAVIDVINYKATTTPSGLAAYTSTGKIRHAGAPHWLGIAAGSNLMNLSSTSGIGTVQLQARGAWI